MNRNSLTEGNISKVLLKLALPIMGTSFIQMAYNLTDMFWVGRLGSLSVAAVGTAGFFTWFSMALIFISKIGAEVGVAQAFGKDDLSTAKSVAKASIQLNLVLAVLYGLLLFAFRYQLIAFFNIGNSEVINNATNYLLIISCGMIFNFINPVFTAILNGSGNSKLPFFINSVGLAINIILDPMMIFGFGPISAMGVRGAAIATVTAQLMVTLIFLMCTRKSQLFYGLHLLQSYDKERILSIVKLGLPVALQNGLFSIFAMFIARIIARWGPVPVAVQRVGSQIEALSWMTAGGFSTALSAFTGQNYGAKKWDRIYKGYFNAIFLVSLIGILATILFVFFGKPIFSMFIAEEEAIKIGVGYLKILGYSQLFMCIEITTGGAFNGIGKTVPPSIVGIVFNYLRIPAAGMLSVIMGLEGIWWSISMSSVFKGVLLTSWFIIVLRRQIQGLDKKSYLESVVEN